MLDEKINDPYSKSLKVLVIEDTPVDQKMLRAMLNESEQNVSLVKLADSLESSLKYLDELEFDVIILDLNLLDSQGLDTLKKINGAIKNTAIVVNTGAYEDNLGLLALRHGAQDFLIKGKYNAYVLNKVMRYSVERKQLENDLRRAYEELKETQSQLIEAEKLKVVGSLASGVAHEVKNPLATILYGVTYLDENVHSDEENYKTVIENVKEATHRANDIITDLLDFSNMSRLKKAEESINDVIQKALSLVSHQIEKNKVKIKFELSENLPAVIIDKNRIEQVFVNVFLNAIQAMTGNGTVTIRSYVDKYSSKFSEEKNIQSLKFKPKDPMLVIEVDDEGCGIDETFREKVFDPFFTTKRTKGGIGLGLSVCKNIIDNHKAEIFLTNRKDGGARVTVLFKY